MTKAQLVDLFLDNLSGGDAPDDVRGKYHPLVIAKYIDVAYAQFLSETLKVSQMNQDFLNMDYYRKTFTGISIKEDSNRNERYSEIPVPIVELPNQESLVIHPDNDPVNQFTPHGSGGADAVFGVLEVQYHNSSKSYRLENNKVYYPGMDDSSCKVTMRVIPMFSAFEDEDEIYLPTGGEARMYDLTIQTMLRKRAVPEDINNNNVAE